MGLASWSVGIDWVMFNPRLQLADRSDGGRSNPDVVQLVDHPGFIATFVARTRSARRSRRRRARR